MIVDRSSVVARTGKHIAVNNKVFHSMGAAGKYIYKDQRRLGHTRSKETISRAIRKFNKSGKLKCNMYGLYDIEIVKFATITNV